MNDQLLEIAAVVEGVLVLTITMVSLFIVVKIARWIVNGDGRPPGAVWYETHSGKWYDKNHKEL